MMSENGHIEIFERYRKGELSEAEQRDFEARLVYDAEFKAAFEEYEQIEVGIKNHFRSELKSKLQDLDQQMDAPVRKSNLVKLVTWTSSVAAAVIIGFFISQHYSEPNNVQLAQQYWPYEEGLPVKMSTKGKYDDAMNAYKLGQFEKAQKLLEPIDSDTAIYFLGVISFEQSDFNQAVEYFRAVDQNSSYFQIARFRAAICYLANNKLASATSILKIQVAEKTRFADVSEEILRKIR